MKMKDELLRAFGSFTEASKLMVDIVRPRPTSRDWEAWAYFESAEDGDFAFHKLNNSLKLNGILIEMEEILESHISCKKNVYEILKKDIKCIIEQQNGKLVSLKESPVKITLSFSCQTIKTLCDTQQKLLKLVQGRTVECFGNKKYFCLFTRTGQMKLTEIQNATKTYIALDSEKKSILIYGPNERCYNAETRIHSLINSKEALSNTKIFDLKSSIIPAGFLKQLYLKYGFDLYGLVRDFDLMAASIDAKSGTLIIEGRKANIRQVEEHLETICAELYKKDKNKIAQDVTGNCAICLDPVMFDYYRLESCGHVFCKCCLLLQLKCMLIPITCAQQDCGKVFLLSDIERISSLGGEELKVDFQNAALKYFASTNAGKVSYCPTPDCPTVYRVSTQSNVEFHCPSCSNDICTHCQTYSHKGMSCDIFQNSKTDEDYSLKVWMRENKSRRKQCPNCKVVIEKFEGCNHMECLNCKKHLCWLCLKIFSNSDLVYDHLPFCPNNQAVND